MALRKGQLFRESFIPVTVVMAVLFLVIFFVQIKVTMDADKVTVVEIESTFETAAMDGQQWEPEQAAVQLSGEEGVEPGYQEAARLMDAQKWDDAEKVYLSILKKGETYRALNDLGVLYYRKGEMQKALKALTRALSSERAYSGAYFNRAAVFYSLGRYDLALSDYRALLRQNPHHYEANYNLGVTLLKMKDHYGAVEAFKAAANSTGGPRKANALYRAGAAYLQLGPGNDRLAREAFEQVIRVQPDNVLARIKLAEMEPDTPEGYERAAAQFEKILTLRPNYAPAHFNIAMFLSARGKTREALAAYGNAIRSNPEYRMARYNLGVLLLSEKRWAEARSQFEWIIKRDPDDERSRFNLGRASFGEKDYERAIEEYQKAIDIRNGDYPEAYVNIGRTYSAMKNYPKAVEVYQKAIKIKEDYPEAWYNIGLVYMRQKEMEEAVSAFQTAIKYDPDNAHSWFNLGVACARLGQEDKAITAYRRALEISPNHKQAQLNLAVRYAKKDQYQDAIRLYRSVLEKDESYSAAWLNLGIAYYKTGEEAAAEEALGKAMALDPDDIKPRVYMARLMRDAKNYDKAVKLLEQVVDMDPKEAEWRLELADALMKAGRIDAANTELKKARLIQPDKGKEIKNNTEGE
ncbi:MAG: tetratricopeptide repeat protein [Deltaproteobacteria bacterium]|nr:tetratricopeptide repeat protein [Deltaproteobacteria bacterium]